MTTSKLDAIAARLEAATPGPWSAHDFGYPGQDEPSSIVIHTGEFDWNGIRYGETEVIAHTDWDSQPAANAEFIAHAPTDIAALLEFAIAVEAAEKEWRRVGGPAHMDDVRFRVAVLAARRALEATT